MKNIKLFEEFDDQTKTVIDINRKINNSKIGNFINKWGSVLEDIIRFDFSLIPYQLENTEAFDKVSQVVQELALLKIAYNTAEKKGTEVRFEDLREYGIDPDISHLLEDEEVLEYFSKDKKLRRKIYNMDEFVILFEEYAEWCKNN